MSESGTHWEKLAARFIRDEGGTLHFTEPAVELLSKYNSDLKTAIYSHFRHTGDEIDARTYLTVGPSAPDERIATQYVPQYDSLVIWKWGEADHDPDLSTIEQGDPEV